MKYNEQLIKRGEELIKYYAELVKHGEQLMMYSEELMKRNEELMKCNEELEKRNEVKIKTKYPMKILNAEESAKLKLKGKGRASVFYTAMLNLEINHVLQIDRKEWRRKLPPHGMARRVEKQTTMKFTVRELADGSGWAIKRTE